MGFGDWSANKVEIWSKLGRVFWPKWVKLMRRAGEIEVASFCWAINDTLDIDSLCRGICVIFFWPTDNTTITKHVHAFSKLEFIRIEYPFKILHFIAIAIAIVSNFSPYVSFLVSKRHGQTLFRQSYLKPYLMPIKGAIALWKKILSKFFW